MALAPGLICKNREIKNTGHLNEIKRNGGVPAVIYGKGHDNTLITLSAREFGKIIKHTGSRGIFSLQVEGQKAPVMALIREIQKNAVSGDILHVDFMTVNMKEKINNIISIHLAGEEELGQEGKVLQVISREIEISCLPGDIPDTISFDVSGLDFGDKITIADLNLPDTIEIMQDADTVLANVLMPGRGYEGEEETAEGEAAEGEAAPAE